MHKQRNKCKKTDVNKSNLIHEVIRKMSYNRILQKMPYRPLFLFKRGAVSAFDYRQKLQGLVMWWKYESIDRAVLIARSTRQHERYTFAQKLEVVSVQVCCLTRMRCTGKCKGGTDCFALMQDVIWKQQPETKWGRDVTVRRGGISRYCKDVQIRKQQIGCLNAFTASFYMGVR